MCVGCKKECTKGHILVKEKIYHPECFKCAECGKELAGKPYIENEQLVTFCEDCYYKKNNPPCAHCEELIRGPYIEAMGKTWHEEHFVCSSCGEPFSGNSFHRHEDRPYCEKDFLEIVGETCTRCGKKIVGEMFLADDGKFHRDCFVCDTGGHGINEGDRFHIFDKKLYCTQHMAELLKLNCAVCQKAILGEYIRVQDQKMHKACWRCKSCNTALSAATAEVYEGHYYCKPCSAKSGFAKERASVTKGGSGGFGGKGGQGGQGGQDEKALSPARPLVEEFFTYEILKDRDFCKEHGIPIQTREMYLADDEFIKVFGLEKDRYQRLPRWKQLQKKRQVFLF